MATFNLQDILQPGTPAYLSLQQGVPVNYVIPQIEFRRKYKLQAKYSNNPDRVIWVSDEVSTSGAPANGMGGGVIGELTILDSWLY